MDTMQIPDMPMPFHAVIFDLDGTLLDTIEDLTDAMNVALVKLGFPPRTIAECKLLVGDGVSTFVIRALPPEARADEEAARQLRSSMRAEYALRCAVKTKPYPGIAEVLDDLTRRKIPKAILSNKPHDSTLSVVGQYFPAWKFEAVLGAREGVPVKPDPSGALEIAGIFGLPPAEILYLGDTNTDMQTAAAAGMYPVGALWGFRSAEELLSNGARALLRRPEDLLPYF